jgi:hypothetical protein
VPCVPALRALQAPVSPPVPHASPLAEQLPCALPGGFPFAAPSPFSLEPQRVTPASQLYASRGVSQAGFPSAPLGGSLSKDSRAPLCGLKAQGGSLRCAQQGALPYAQLRPLQDEPSPHAKAFRDSFRSVLPAAPPGDSPPDEQRWLRAYSPAAKHCRAPALPLHAPRQRQDGWSHPPAARLLAPSLLPEALRDSPRSAPADCSAPRSSPASASPSLRSGARSSPAAPLPSAAA